MHKQTPEDELRHARAGLVNRLDQLRRRGHDAEAEHVQRQIMRIDQALSLSSPRADSAKDG
jgi:hypothetical protein